MIFTIIIYSSDQGYNSYVEFQLGLQNSINMRVLKNFATFTATRIHGLLSVLYSTIIKKNTRLKKISFTPHFNAAAALPL